MDKKVLLSARDRFWAALMHVPIFTIIWFFYIIFFVANNGVGSLFDAVSSVKTIPITPILFTLLSMPISLTIGHIRRTSMFLVQQAAEVHRFNVAVLHWYGIGIMGILVGNMLNVSPVSYLFLGLMTMTSCNSLIQSILGLKSALQGRLYRYWHFVF